MDCFYQLCLNTSMLRNSLLCFKNHLKKWNNKLQVIVSANKFSILIEKSLVDEKDKSPIVPNVSTFPSVTINYALLKK